MEDLIKRLEAAEVGSRELDCEIYAIENPHMKPVRSQVGRFFDPKRASEHSAEKYHISGGATGTAPRYTTSLDAALALAERVLPGCSPGMSQNVHSRDWFAWLGYAEDGEAKLHAQTFGKTPALALCIAILRAKQIDTAQNLR